MTRPDLDTGTKNTTLYFKIIKTVFMLRRLSLYLQAQIFSMSDDLNHCHK